MSRHVDKILESTGSSCSGIVLALVLCSALMGGCTFVRAGKLYAPESFGLEQVTPAIYVEAGADMQTRTRLRQATVQAEAAVRAAYGSVVSRPIVHACVSERCYESFGGQGSIAKAYADRILLSPRGLTWHFLAHEWSHAEMRNRLTFSAWLRLPQWFDEGVAVSVSEAGEHSESHWQYLVRSGIPRPTTEELHTLKSLHQWLAAVHKYGEDRNIERQARGEMGIRPVYAAAGHEVRPWLAEAGTAGLLALIARMNAGEEFEGAYRAAIR